MLLVFISIILVYSFMTDIKVIANYKMENIKFNNMAARIMYSPDCFASSSTHSTELGTRKVTEAGVLEFNKINKGQIKRKDYSRDMKLVFKLSQQTKLETDGYFDIFHNGKYDPSGLVKGWAIYKAAELIRNKGYKNFFVEAGGDIQVSGKNKKSFLVKNGY